MSLITQLGFLKSSKLFESLNFDSSLYFLEHNRKIEKKSQFLLGKPDLQTISFIVWL